MRRSIGIGILATIMQTRRVIAGIGSASDSTLRFWAQCYPAYAVRRVALLEMARRERMEEA
jgi:hypothetical protein